MSLLGRLIATTFLFLGTGYIVGIIQAPLHSEATRLVAGILFLGSFIMAVADEVIFAIRDSKKEWKPASTGDTAEGK